MVDFNVKVGDQVIITRSEKDWNVQGKMDQYIGTIQQVSSIHLDIKGIHVKFVGDDEGDDINYWYWRLHHIEPYTGVKKVLKLKFKSI